MSEIGQIKSTNVKRGNSGLDPKTFDINKELLDAMRIIARQEVEKSKRDITKTGKITEINNDGTVTVEIDGRTYGKIPNYNGTTLDINNIVKVTYPQGQASNMYISGGGLVENTKTEINGITTYGELQLNSQSSDTSSLEGSQINFYGKGGNTGYNHSIDAYNDTVRVLLKSSSSTKPFIFKEDGLYLSTESIATVNVGQYLVAGPSSSMTLKNGVTYDICSLTLPAGGKWIVWASSIASGDYSLINMDSAPYARNYWNGASNLQRNITVMGVASGGKTITFRITARQVDSTINTDNHYHYIRAIRIR